MIRERIRIVGAEPCLRCKAKRKQRCKDCRGRNKATCHVVIACRRCASQLGQCRHPERTLSQRDLFPYDHPAWIPAAAVPAVGTTGDDQRRSVK